MICAEVMKALPNGFSVLGIFAQVPEQPQHRRHQAVLGGDGPGREQLVDALADDVVRVVNDGQH